MRRLKLIWDFRGPVASQTATHHEIHLKEYAQAEGLLETFTGVEIHSEMHTIAFLVVNEDQMPPVRDALKPHRGQLYTQI
jgi:hypothetical protein